jgi:hypothetical protein
MDPKGDWNVSEKSLWTEFTDEEVIAVRGEKKMRYL